MRRQGFPWPRELLWTQDLDSYQWTKARAMQLLDVQCRECCMDVVHVGDLYQVAETIRFSFVLRYFHLRTSLWGEISVIFSPSNRGITSLVCLWLGLVRVVAFAALRGIYETKTCARQLCVSLLRNVVELRPAVSIQYTFWRPISMAQSYQER